MNKKEKSLRYISHGVYLQLFFGVSFLLIDIFLGEKTPGFMTGLDNTGGLLILLGLNSLIYINRYKKALKTDP